MQSLFLYHNKLQGALNLRSDSMVMTLYGDAFAPRRQAIWLGSLIQLLAPFGISSRQVRTSVYRLAQDQWFGIERIGRRSYYGLSPIGLQRVQHAGERIYEFSAAPWDGNWTLVFIDAKWKLSTRQKLRRQLQWDGFGQLAPNILAHPRAKQQSLVEIIEACDAKENVTLLKAASIDLYSRKPLIDLMQQTFVLASIDNAWRQFIKRFAPLSKDAASLSPADAFYVRTLLIHEYRRILLRDPNLPEALLPTAWSGLEARQLCQVLYEDVKAASEAYLMETVQTLEGALVATPDEIAGR
jgi:phenylacetic acid degradation operon negative regulatory protein